MEPGVLSAHARMYRPPNWPPASVPPTGLWLALYQTAVLRAADGRPRLCPGQQLHWPDSLARWTSCASALRPKSSPSQVTQGAGEKENQSSHTLRNCFCGPKASKKHTVLFPFLQYHQFWYFIFNHSS